MQNSWQITLINILNLYAVVLCTHQVLYKYYFIKFQSNCVRWDNKMSPSYILYLDNTAFKTESKVVN